MQTKFLLLFALLTLSLKAETTTPLHDDWRLQSACKTEAKGDAITAANFSTTDWLKTAVPSTVLAAQVAAGLFPDPYFSDNLRKIPGTDYPVGKNFAELPMSDSSPYHCGFWFRKEFPVPAAENSTHFWLHFGGINYRADIWLNGQRIADTSTIAGAYRIYNLDVTAQIQPGKPNVLAVETFAPTDRDLGVTWVDWNPGPPDKDMGLWGGVDLITSSAVTLRSPMATTHFPDASLSVAELTVSAELHNASDHAVKGVVSGTAAGISFEEPIELAAHEDRSVILTPQKYPQLHLKSPRLWWPYQMGTPHLEHLTMRFTESGKLVDEQTIDFGLREVTSELTANGSRLFRINGKPILIRGGGWSQDMMLRYNPARIREQFKLVHDLNLNTIRLEGKLEPDDFFNLADEQGILIFPGWSCCDHHEHWKDWTPQDLVIATSALREQLTRLRAHPSVLVWLNGSDNAPPANVERAYVQVESEVRWPNPISSAASSANTSVTGLNGVKMTGPYDYVAPSYWYVDTKNGGAYGFNTETSPGPAIPSLASREKFLSDPKAWPPTAEWSLHNGGGEFATLKVFDEAMAAVYAEPHSAADYERISGALEYDSERAMFEAYSRNKYDSTGVIQWMLNNAWPSMIWHLYDYFLEAGPGYYAVKKACEPLHIQYSYDDHSIIVVNSTYAEVTGLHASVHVHSLDWKDLYSADSTLTSAADSSIRTLAVPDALYAHSGNVLFIDLTLTNDKNELVSHNFYWVPTTLTTFDFPKTDFTHTPAAQHENLTALTQLPPAEITATAEIESTKKGHEIRLHLTNKSTTLAFQVSAAARTPTGGLIAPVPWSDNWIELAPGESRVLTAPLPDDAPAQPVVQLSGWNIAPPNPNPPTRPEIKANPKMPTPTQPAELKRSLRFRDLVLYGIILIQPTAPMPSFGVIYHDANGHVITAILLAMVAMLFTSVSYGRMARAYPQGGSAFLYVGKEIHSALGYMTGWCLIMDYILNPLICTIWCARATMNFLPGVPYVVLAVFFALFFTLLNCVGVETSARINAVMAAILGGVIILILIAAVRWLMQLSHPTASFFTLPFYDPATFTSSGLLRGTSIAVLTYIGFDGISTLTDEAKDPARSVPRAIVLTCFITGVLASIEVYVAQLAWPRNTPFPDIDTAYVHVTGRIGGPILFAIVNAALLLATVGSGFASQMGAARLLYAMGKDGALPRRFFASVHPRTRIPRNNVLLIGAICLAGALVFSYERGAELLNYGALLAFMGVNAASMLRSWREQRMGQAIPILLSLLGLLTCFFLWINLGKLALEAGSAWAITGIVLWIIRRRYITLPAEAA